MKCPYCGHKEDKVVDSRATAEESAIRRRRECLKCGKRFTTYEYIEEVSLMVIKKDGRREVYNREKVASGLFKACEKRKISVNAIEEFLDDLERDLKETGEKEIPSAFIGEKVIQKLHQLDKVAYVRFASVYREFKDVNDFFSELKNLLAEQK